MIGTIAPIAGRDQDVAVVRGQTTPGLPDTGIALRIVDGDGTPNGLECTCRRDTRDEPGIGILVTVRAKGYVHTVVQEK